jgi:hypothetical protein
MTDKTGDFLAKTHVMEDCYAARKRERLINRAKSIAVLKRIHQSVNEWLKQENGWREEDNKWLKKEPRQEQ